MNRPRTATRRLSGTSITKPQRIAYVQSAWHQDIVAESRKGFLAQWKALGQDGRNIDFYSVPGAFEIPLHAQRLARTGRYEAIVAAGFVVDGGIYRHEFVADAVIKALMQVQLETDVPVISAVLTPHEFHAHEEHERFFRHHFRVKGSEAATACLATLASLARLASQTG